MITNMSTTLQITISTAVLLIGLGYGKSKTGSDKGRFTLALLSLAATIASGFYSVKCMQHFEIFTNGPTTIYHCFPVLFSPLIYVLGTLTLVCFCAWEKGGFNMLIPMRYKTGILTSSKIGAMIGGIAFLMGSFIVTLVSIAVFLSNSSEPEVEPFNIMPICFWILVGFSSMGLVFSLFCTLISGCNYEFSQIADPERAEVLAYRADARIEVYALEEAKRKSKNLGIEKLKEIVKELLLSAETKHHFDQLCKEQFGEETRTMTVSQDHAIDWNRDNPGRQASVLIQGGKDSIEVEVKI